MSLSLVERIRAAQRLTKTIRWPGTDEAVTLRVLGKDDQQAATFAADKRFVAAGVGIAVHTVDAYRDEETIQVLFRALTDAEGKPVGGGVDVFRALCTTDVLTALSREYRAFESEVSPDPDRLDDEGLKRLEEELKKKPDEILGSVSNTDVLRRLARSLASQLPH